MIEVLCIGGPKNGTLVLVNENNHDFAIPYDSECAAATDSLSGKPISTAHRAIVWYRIYKLIDLNKNIFLVALPQGNDDPVGSLMKGYKHLVQENKNLRDEIESLKRLL